MTEAIQFIVNEQGVKIAAIISVEEYEKILEKLGNVEALRAFRLAKISTEPISSPGKVIARIEPSR